MGGKLNMKEMIQSIIHDGKSVKMYKDPGFYTLDFYPIVSVRIPEDEIKNVFKDLKQIISKIKK